MVEHDVPVIMLVDDDIDIVDVISRLLTDNGYKVLSFTSTAEAMACLETEKPDLVITDLMMESLDSGFVFSRCLKENPSLRHIPVIIITAAGSQRGFDFRPTGPEDLEAMHVSAFLEKPVNPRQLLAKIAEILGKIPGGN
ncbi:MAG TPA: response regulator [Candidatus Hydrogenedentes bacterium]|nr:response regulator [Candidatus Hydrogenedentota bacterium]HOT50932.1 response regulator [Candidatus Hydrogenedentota bacterium]HOV73515.1 response regulator [Candidatus Hydrogenedentota bacterium]HPC16157.1 response regulator [Candidatus Hydrogenedentota bacterium]HRT18915.1 response regulator [Candidatus Hydrogenedentota bacterium]